MELYLQPSHWPSWYVYRLTFTHKEYNGHVVPVMLLHKVININFISNNIMGYWKLLTSFT